MSHDPFVPPEYYAGRDAREHEASKLANPHRAISVKGAWWLAGWNDRDRELWQ